MIAIALLTGGLILGAVLAVFLVGRMMKNPSMRIWLSDWVNWSNNDLPENCYQLVRHGKWIATPENKEDLQHNEKP